MSSLVIFQALEPLQPQWPLQPQQPPWPQWPIQPHFIKKNDWYWWLNHFWHHNDQYLSLIGEWILENPIFHWYLVPFLSEAVEASPCYFFQNWLIKLKCPILLKPLDTITQENYQSFYPSEPFRITRFKMRHPVIAIMWSAWDVFSKCKVKCFDQKGYRFIDEHWF